VQKKDLPQQVSVPINHIDSFTLINITLQKIDFVYYDKFGNYAQFFIAPQKTRTFKMDSFIVLTQPNRFQNNYLITKGDSIEVNLNENYNVILTSKNDSGENKNLNISPYINERLNFTSSQLSSLIGAKKTVWYLVDSSIMDNYANQLKLLNEYCQKFNCSEIVKKYFELEFKSSLLNYKFFIGQTYKNQLSIAYAKQLDSLNNKLDEIYLNRFANRNGNLRISFMAYKHQMGIKTISNDTLYSYSQNNIPNKTDEEAKFWVVKSELQYNKKSSKWFIKDFKETCSNKELIDYIISLEENNKIIYITGGNNKLLTKDKKSLDYDSLIKSYEGNIIYLDLWASWCVPCRASMGASHELNKRFKDKKVVFLYASIDEKIDAWIKASEEENLDIPKSFLLLNSMNSNLIKKLKVTSVPRYIIIGKNGKIVNPDAPAPNDALLMNEITKLL
jgi:thiol-disulfide isomerase/thioredoxin